MPADSVNVRRSLHAVLGAVVVFTVACSDGPSSPRDETRSIVVNNDLAALAASVSYANARDLPIEPVTPSAGLSTMSALQAATAAAPLSLQLVAEVASPVVNGRTLEATHVVAVGNNTYVSYNAAGEESVGAIASFNTTNSQVPTLVSFAALPNADANAIVFSGGRLFVAEASTDTAFADRAVLERVDVHNGQFRGTTTRVGLPSYAATGIAIYRGFIFVTSGTGGPRQGGFTMLEESTLRKVYSDSFPDARALAIVPEANLAIAVQGTPGRARLYDVTTGQLRVADIAIGGSTLRNSKGNVQVVRDWAFIAAGDGGMKVLSVARRQVIDGLARPTATGVAPENLVTNAVAVDNNLIFLANGGAGLWVASKSGNGSAGTSPNVTLLGKVNFGGTVSTNYVAVSGSLLFVAAGRGGLKIIKVTQ